MPGLQRVFDWCLPGAGLESSLWLHLLWSSTHLTKCHILLLLFFWKLNLQCRLWMVDIQQASRTWWPQRSKGRIVSHNFLSTPLELHNKVFLQWYGAFHFQSRKSQPVQSQLFWFPRLDVSIKIKSFQASNLCVQCDVRASGWLSLGFWTSTSWLCSHRKGLHWLF